MKKIMFVLAFVLAALFCLPSCAAPDAEPECSCRLYIDYNSYIPVFHIDSYQFDFVE